MTQTRHEHIAAAHPILTRFWFGNGPPGNCALSFAANREGSQGLCPAKPMRSINAVNLRLRAVIVAGVEQHATVAVPTSGSLARTSARIGLNALARRAPLTNSAIYLA